MEQSYDVGTFSHYYFGNITVILRDDMKKYFIGEEIGELLEYRDIREFLQKLYYTITLGELEKDFPGLKSKVPKEYRYSKNVIISEEDVQLLLEEEGINPYKVENFKEWMDKISYEMDEGVEDNFSLDFREVTGKMFQTLQKIQNNVEKIDRKLDTLINNS